MSILPDLDPLSTTSTIVLPITGTASSVVAALPLGIYSTSTAFISGAVDQVAYTYKKLGGDILDIELTEQNIYACYEESVLEYSYVINLHQAKNALPNLLGSVTGTFDEDGEIVSGPTNASLKYPKFVFQYSRRIAEGISAEAGVGGYNTMYSASFSPVSAQQEYDLQSIVSGSTALSGTVGNKRIRIHKVYYKTAYAMWRFFGYYGGLSVVGNLGTYGQYADDSTFSVIPTWQNKAQAMAYEDAIYTRVSQFSFEVHNNKLLLYPAPTSVSPTKMWIKFSLNVDPIAEDSSLDEGVGGINNVNTLPFANIPFENINSIGKQWIRRYAISCAKETLGHVRGKFQTVPIPGESVTLNWSELLVQAKEEKEILKTELKEILDELTYNEVAKRQSEMVEENEKIQKQIPFSSIYTG
jgi:hypothetical protein